MPEDIRQIRSKKFDVIWQKKCCPKINPKLYDIDGGTVLRHLKTRIKIIRF